MFFYYFVVSGGEGKSFCLLEYARFGNQQEKLCVYYVFGKGKATAKRFKM